MERKVWFTPISGRWTEEDRKRIKKKLLKAENEEFDWETVYKLLGIKADDKRR